jgi:hypothetical protein
VVVMVRELGDVVLRIGGMQQSICVLANLLDGCLLMRPSVTGREFYSPHRWRGRRSSQHPRTFPCLPFLVPPSASFRSRHWFSPPFGQNRLILPPRFFPAHKLDPLPLHGLRHPLFLVPPIVRPRTPYPQMRHLIPIMFVPNMIGSGWRRRLCFGLHGIDRKVLGGRGGVKSLGGRLRGVRSNWFRRRSIARLRLIGRGRK